MTRNRTQWYLVGLGVAAVVIALLVLITLVARPLQIAYHDQRVQAIFAEIERPDLSSDAATANFTRLQSHLDRLALLGSVAKREYRLTHVRSRTAESEHLWKRIVVAKDCPSWRHAKSESSKPPGPIVITIWCDPENADDWDRFIQSVDVPDYRERLMNEQ